MKKKTRKKTGQSLVEYGLILAMVSLVAFVVLQTMGDSIKTFIDTVTQRMQQANTVAQTP